MNDFVKIAKNLTDERLNLSTCDETSFFTAGELCNLRNYKLKKQHTEIDIRLNESTGELIVKGNIGMFWNGHNIFLPFTDFKEAINYISDRINVDLFTGAVKELDHSSTISTTLNPKLIIQNHLSLPGHLTKEQKHGKYFVKAGKQILKLYDADRRMKQVYCKPMREKIYLSLGIEPNSYLIRFEKKIPNPQDFFNRLITVNELLHPEFILQLNTDLMDTYNKIYKSGTLEIPTDKKHLTAATLPLILAKELELIYGFDFADLLKKRIASIDDNVLTKEDKKARRRQIKANLNKIRGKVRSEYDLSDQLAESLKMNPCDIG